MGKNLLKGQFSDLMKIGTPAYIHSHQSYLHMISKDLSFYEYYMREAMKRPEDPVWKLKNIVMAVLATLHLVVEQGTKSPLNPILGETLVQESESGMRVYCEQTSHHPPISNFLIEGPPDCLFKVYGHFEYRVKVRGMFSHVDVSMPGRVSIELPDGSKYQSEYPQLTVEGLMSSEKVINPHGELRITDQTSNHQLVVDFDTERDRRSSGIMGFFKKGPPMTETGGLEHRKDLVTLTISKIEDDE